MPRNPKVWEVEDQSLRQGKFSSPPPPRPPTPPPEHTLKQPIWIKLSFTTSDALFNIFWSATVEKFIILLYWMLNRSFNMLNVVERWCSIPFKKEMLLVGWTTTLPAFCWATNIKRCWTVAHWLIGLTQMTKASVKTDQYLNKCGLRPDKLRL